MKIKYFQIGAIIINSILIILLLVLENLEYIIIKTYDVDFSIIFETRHLPEISYVRSIFIAFIFFIFILKPDKRVINQMKYWQLFLAIFFINSYIRYHLGTMISTAAIMWTDIIGGSASVFTFNVQYTYISLIIVFLYLIFSLFLHYFSIQAEEYDNMYSNFSAEVTDKLILALFLISTLNYRILALFNITNEMLEYLFEVYYKLIESMFVGIGLLVFRFKYIEDKQIGIKQFIIGRGIFIFLFSLLFSILMYINYLNTESDSYYALKLVFVVVAAISIYIIIGFGIDLILRKIVKRSYSVLFSRIFRIIKSYIAIISIITILLLIPIIYQSFSHPYEYGQRFFEVESYEDNIVNTRLYFESNNILFEPAMKEMVYNLTFSALMIFSKTDNGFKMEEIVNITSVRFNSITLVISSNYTLLFDSSKIYDLQITTEQPLIDTEYVGLAMYNYYGPYKYNMVAIFPELVLELL